MSTRTILRSAALPLLAAPVLAQLPAPTLILRDAPRASWTALLSTGTSSTTVNQRADNPGAASSSKLYVFGGCKGNNTAVTLNDLWEFDPATGTFAQLLPNTTVPAVGVPTHRGRAMVAWNFATNKLIVFGGNTRNGGDNLQTPTLLNDTWEWDPNTNAWTDLTPSAGIPPSAREHAAMAWDPGSGGMLLFGGDTNGAGATPLAPQSDTWLLIGGAWAPMSPTNVPAARANHSMCTRTAPYNDVIMCVGGDYSVSTNQLIALDTWKWSGFNWTLLNDGTVTWPASGIGHQAVYDAARQKVVVQGGQGLTTANGTLYGPDYGGSPTQYTSEYDCVTNSWSIFANPTTGTSIFNLSDPVIHRVSRYFGGYIASTGKVYKACGQDATTSGSNPVYNVYEYQANPMAAAAAGTPSCSGPNGPITLSTTDLPWLGTAFDMTVSGQSASWAVLGYVGFSLQPVPIPVGAIFGSPPAIPGCTADINLDLEFGVLGVGNPVAWSAAIPPTTSLAGFVAYLQAGTAALDFSAVGSSNVLTATLGIRD